MESDTLAKGIPLEESLALTRALLFKHFYPHSIHQ